MHLLLLRFAAQPLCPPLPPATCLVSPSPPPAGNAAGDEAERRRKAEEGLPEGWAVAFDAQKKPYYWHRRTKKTTWEKPTADTPIN